jgi:ferrochelatase
MHKKPAVILMAYGSPGSLSDIPAYLNNVRAGRQPSQDLIDKVTARYERIGGRSPLLAVTQRIAQKLKQSVDMPVYIGMLHWHPYLEDTTAEMMDDGIKRMIAICLAPHFSELSIGKYHSRLADTLHASGGDVDLHFVKSWHDQSDYLAGLAAHVRKGWERFPLEKRDQIKVIFTAHSLPTSFLKEDSVYQDQLRETAHALAKRLDLLPERWVLAYQSAPQLDSSWLGPHLEILLKIAAQEGKRHVLVTPIGFITDHLEILYDIDVKCQAIAQFQGMDLKRVDMLNDSPALVAALANLVKRNLDIYD